MLGLHELDLMARGGAIALLALWSTLLIRDRRGALAARIAVLMNLSILAHVVATIPGAATHIPPIDFMTEVGAGTVPGLFWLFARTWFNDETHISWRSWLLVLASSLIVTVLIVTSNTKGPVFYATAALMRTVMFAFAVAGLWLAWRGRDNDLVEARRLLRTRLIGAVGGFVILINFIEILVHNDIIPDVWRSLIEIAVMALTFGFCVTMFGHRQTDLFGPQRVANPERPAPDADDPLAQRLLTVMQIELPHRDETMTIAKLALMLGEQEYRLRRLINGRLGHRNFATFLNGYRLAEVKQALADPEQKDVPILTIALDAGFGSLGPFNRAFREAEGTTPSAWRVANHLPISESASRI